MEISLRDAEAEWLDHLVIGAHSDQAVAMLADRSPREPELLCASAYDDNDTVLHRDETLMQSRRRD